jgi:ATP-dependent metalloprotease
MGGHVAEKLIIGSENISSGCGSDLQGATRLAVNAVRSSGMFGDRISYSSTKKKDTSDVYNAEVDRVVTEILQESFERVELLL